MTSLGDWCDFCPWEETGARCWAARCWAAGIQTRAIQPHRKDNTSEAEGGSPRLQLSSSKTSAQSFCCRWPLPPASRSAWVPRQDPLETVLTTLTQTSCLHIFLQGTDRSLGP